MVPRSRALHPLIVAGVIVPSALHGRLAFSAVNSLSAARLRGTVSGMGFSSFV